MQPPGQGSHPGGHRHEESGKDGDARRHREDGPNEEPDADDPDQHHCDPAALAAAPALRAGLAARREVRIARLWRC
jgi:hypothetical protein